MHHLTPSAHLIPMTVQPMTQEQTDDVQAWVALALERMPYMAAMLFSLRFVNTPGLGTFAVDKHHRCYVDFDAVTSKGAPYCSQALLHECSHLFGAHFSVAEELGVSGGQMADALNLANDASINDDLRDAGLPIFADGAGHILPSSLGQKDYQTPHVYFRALQAAMAKKAQQQPSGQQSQQSQGQGQQGQPGQSSGQSASGQGAQPSGDQQTSTGGAGVQTRYKGCGSGAGGNAAPGELDDNDDLGGAAPAATNTETERVRVSTASAIRDFAAKGRGTVPGGFVEYADQILTPSKVPWQRVLGRTVRGCVRSRIGSMDVSFNRRNGRRHNERVLTPNGPGHRVIVPASSDPVPILHVIRDTSGSVSNDELAVITSEVVAIATKLRVRGDDLIITDVDAAVHGSQGFNGARALGEVKGRGGTDMCVGIEHALASKPKPTAVIVMTDGGTPWPATQTGRIPVIAVIVGKTPEAAAKYVPTWIRAVLVETD